MYHKSLFIGIAFIALAGCKPPEKNEATGAKSGTPVPATAHSGRNSLDWAGIYSGTLPCTGCEGIQTEIRLNKDLTYQVTSRYLTKAEDIYRGSGSFTWDESGNKITLQEAGAPAITVSQYQVGENLLTALDTKGEMIQTELAASWTLKKVIFDSVITEKYWKLIELNGKDFVLTGQKKKEPHFILKAQDNRVTGFAGCNSFNGAYELSAGNRIRFSKIITTLMACMDAGYEKDFVRVFDMADNYTLKGDTLSLNRARMAPLAKFAAVYLR